MGKFDVDKYDSIVLNKQEIATPYYLEDLLQSLIGLPLIYKKDGSLRKKFRNGDFYIYHNYIGNDIFLYLGSINDRFCWCFKCENFARGGIFIAVFPDTKEFIVRYL